MGKVRVCRRCIGSNGACVRKAAAPWLLALTAEELVDRTPRQKYSICTKTHRSCGRSSDQGRSGGFEFFRRGKLTGVAPYGACLGLLATSCCASHRWQCLLVCYNLYRSAQRCPATKYEILKKKKLYHLMPRSGYFGPTLTQHPITHPQPLPCTTYRSLC